jgi:hypothetical protein
MVAPANWHELDAGHFGERARKGTYNALNAGVTVIAPGVMHPVVDHANENVFFGALYQHVEPH